MNINYTARHFTLSSGIKKQAERRMKVLERLLGLPLEVNVLLSVEKYRNKAEINVKSKGATLHAVEETSDMFNSLGLAFDKIEKRMKREKERSRERKRRRNREMGDYSAEVRLPQGEKKIIRSRSYSFKPMSPEEALLLLESSKEEAFVFRKFDSEKWAVIYRRKDGNFGLVEPE